MRSGVWSKPTDNSVNETFNGSFRDECLNLQWFASVGEAKLEIEAWLRDYNENRPHMALNDLTPAEFARKHSLRPLAEVSKIVEDQLPYPSKIQADHEREKTNASTSNSRGRSSFPGAVHNHWRFGMKAYIGVHADLGLVHFVVGPGQHQRCRASARLGAWQEGASYTAIERRATPQLRQQLLSDDIDRAPDLAARRPSSSTTSP